MNKAQRTIRQSASNQILKAGGISVGLALASTPILGAAELALEDIRDQVCGAHILTQEQRANLPGRSEVAITFEGLSGLTYEIWSTVDDENWELQGSAICDEGVGQFSQRISTAEGPRYQLLTTKSMDAASPLFSRNASLHLESVGDGSIELSWSAADDDTGVVAYALCENGEHIATIEGAGPARVSVDGLEQGREYEYDLVAFDAAGNGTQLPDGLVLRSLLIPAVQKASKSVVDTGYDYNHEDSLRSSGIMKRVDKSSPLLARFGGEDIGEVILDSTSFDDEPLTLEVREDPGARRSLVGVPPGIGLTFQRALKTEAVWDDADVVHVVHDRLGSALGYTATDDLWLWVLAPSITSLPVGGDVLLSVEWGGAVRMMTSNSGSGGWSFHHHHMHISRD